MSDLATLLDLPGQSRLTDITLPLLDHRRADRATTAHLQWMTVPGLSSPSAHASALAAFIDDTCATASGHTPDGDGWIAVAVLAFDGSGLVMNDADALLPLRRALDLIGLVPSTIRTAALTGPALTDCYWTAGGLESPWTVPDLVLGLLIELTGSPLGDVIAIGEGYGAYGLLPSDNRRERLSAVLRSWAVHYEGPEL